MMCVKHGWLLDRLIPKMYQIIESNKNQTFSLVTYLQLWPSWYQSMQSLSKACFIGPMPYSLSQLLIKISGRTFARSCTCYFLAKEIFARISTCIIDKNSF